MGNSEQLEQQVGFFLNQQTADLTVLRVVLQVLIWNIVRRDPQGLGILGLLKQEVLTSLNNTLTIPPGLQGRQEAERVKQLTLMRAEKVFQDIEHALTAEQRNARPTEASAAN
jgi:hypothetical protein